MTEPTQRLRRSEVERKLGTNAMRLLEAWWSVRSSKSCETFAKLLTAAARAGLTPKQAKTATARLRQAGFVRPIGMETRQGGQRVYWRRIAGTQGQAPWEHAVHIHVPHQAAVWLRAASDARGWGGARKGAGRKTNEERKRLAIAANEERKRAEIILTNPEEEVPVKARRPLYEEHEDGGFSIGPARGGTAQARVALETSRRALLAQDLLPCPKSSEIGEAPLPWPPLVRRDDPEVHRARLLANAYRGAVEMICKTKCLPFSRGAITRSKHYKKLLVAAQVMCELKIPPASWVAWSIMVWKTYRHAREEQRGRKKLSIPSVQWIFSTKRLEEHVGWFNSEANSYLGGRSTPGPGWKHFANARARAVARISAGDDPDQVIAQVFPEGYERALRNAKLESERITRDRKARAMDGEWVWTFL